MMIYTVHIYNICLLIHILCIYNRYTIYITCEHDYIPIYNFSNSLIDVHIFKYAPRS